MFCSASFNKRFLVVINFVYIIAAFILIGVASHAKHANIAETLPVVGGIIACGVFLLFTALLGLFATFKQSQALMFYFMIILGIIFILQFFISIACLGIKHEKEVTLVESAWNLLGGDSPDPPIDEIHTTETTFRCCGINDNDFRRNKTYWAQNLNDKNETVISCPEATIQCKEINWCMSSSNGIDCHPPTNLTSNFDYGCPTCLGAIDDKIDKAFNSTGGVGLFFSFVELIAIVSAFIY